MFGQYVKSIFNHESSRIFTNNLGLCESWFILHTDYRYDHANLTIIKLFAIVDIMQLYTYCVNKKDLPRGALRQVFLRSAIVDLFC